jgi:DNA-binding MarR family transcriptional regulator
MTAQTDVGGAERVAKRRLKPHELVVWRMFLRAHSRLTRRLEADLIAEHSLPLASYDVLLTLMEAPNRRLRMTELADHVLLSRSGMTRLVDRLEREGLVMREACANDARGMFTVLTEAGHQRLRKASRTHLRGVEEYAVSKLSPDELEAFGKTLAKLLDE